MAAFNTVGAVAPANEGNSIRVPWAVLDGLLLLIDVHDVKQEVATIHGPKKAIVADVTCIETGESYPDALIFGAVLPGQLENSVGEKVLVRLGKGTARDGKQAPWKLLPATDADQASATEYQAANPAPPF